MTSKRLYIKTFGCQMNVYDTEQITRRLGGLGYVPADDPESADLIICNTCSVREKAEQKAFSFLGRLSSIKRRRPALLIGVGGCMAQRAKKRVLKRLPHVDFVFGTGAVPRIDSIVSRVETDRLRIIDTELPGETAAYASLPGSSGQPSPAVSRFVTIMQGCDNFCSYCIVPFVRGREASRPPGAVAGEIEGLVRAGAREVTLLGQNVNSYGKKEGHLSFPGLLRHIHAIDGLERIRFTTSHPKDLSDELIEAFATLPKLCRHIHLPVQSGSNRILNRMNRKYTAEDYVDKVDRLRAAAPGIAVTTDFIVGFPGETDDDFEQTLNIIRTIDFDALFAFAYSDRLETPAARFPDKIPAAVKRNRLHRLLALQEANMRSKHEQMVGTEIEILIDDYGPAPPSTETRSFSGEPEHQWTGRTPANRLVHIPESALTQAIPPLSREDSPRLKKKGIPDLTGRLIPVKIESAFAHSLRGIPLYIPDFPVVSKGE